MASAVIVEDNDSGMESQEGSQSVDVDIDETKNKKKTAAIEEGSADDEPEETLGERLWGLTEMFPEGVRNFTYSTFVNTQLGICKAYDFSRNATWFVFSTSIILFAPVIFEVEKANFEEMQRNQQKQMLLGPNSAISGGVPPPLLPPPAVQSR